MDISKIKKPKELITFLLIYVCLFTIAIITNDSKIALISAFCGITYTILAGKGNPVCFPIGAFGSALYAYLSFASQLWGNLLLYLCYYVPMQIIGFFKWNKNLKSDKYEIVKTQLTPNQRLTFFLISALISVAVIILLANFGDKNPVIDGITTVFSILGMILSVKRVVEQWIIWIGVNFLSLLMWLDVILKGEKVYSTVFMWGAYFLLAIYFYITWKKELESQEDKA